MSTNNIWYQLICFYLIFDMGPSHAQSIQSYLSPSSKVLTGLPVIESKVYSDWEMPVKKNETRQTSQVFEGSTTHMEYFEVSLIVLDKGSETVQSEVHLDFEELIIVKEGQVSIAFNDQSNILGAGSIAFILPEDKYKLEPVGSATTSYYRLRYRSKSPVDLARGVRAGGSFVVDWNEVVYREHEKGGRRDFFDRPTAMCEDFEMHVTNLNENTSSHAPHTHDVEEIILMINGDISMHIAGTKQKATRGDLAFLDSMVPHAPTNIGSGQCIYFAFQWK